MNKETAIKTIIGIEKITDLKEYNSSENRIKIKRAEDYIESLDPIEREEAYEKISKELE